MEGNMTLLQFALAALAGAALGYLIAFLIGKASLASIESQLNSSNTIADDLRRTLTSCELRLSQEQAANLESSREIQRLTTTLEKERESFQEQVNGLNRAEQSLKDSFSKLAADALKGNNEQFLTLAEQKFGQSAKLASSELETKKKEVEGLTTPLAETLVKLQAELQELEKNRSGAYAGVLTELTNLVGTQKELKSETNRLVSALRAPAKRGRWGEMELKRILEFSGMLEHCNFREQQSFTTEDGRSRPDFIVNLPGERQIVVDSKVSLPPDLDPSASDEEKQRAGRKYAALVRNQVSELGSKAYWEQLDCSPEFVVGFMHDEGCLSLAWHHDPDLIEFAAQQRVILATPTLLIALLRTVEYGWRQEKLAKNAAEISGLGQVLYERLANLFDHLTGLKKNLEGSVGSFNSLVGTLESRVMVTARKLRQLGASGGEEITSVESIERIPREITDNRIPAQTPLPMLLDRVAAVGDESSGAHEEEE